MNVVNNIGTCKYEVYVQINPSQKMRACHTKHAFLILGFLWYTQCALEIIAVNSYEVHLFEVHNEYSMYGRKKIGKNLMSGLKNDRNC